MDTCECIKLPETREIGSGDKPFLIFFLIDFVRIKPSSEKRWRSFCAYCFRMLSNYRVFSLTWPASVQIYWNKKKRLHKERVELPQHYFGIPTWSPFHCFGTPIWPLLRHVKTLYKIKKASRQFGMPRECWNGSRYFVTESNDFFWQLFLPLLLSRSLRYVFDYWYR